MNVDNNLCRRENRQGKQNMTIFTIIIYILLALSPTANTQDQDLNKLSVIHESLDGGLSATIHGGKLYLFQHTNNSAVIYDLRSGKKLSHIPLQERTRYGGVIRFFEINGEIYYGEHRGDTFIHLHDQQNRINNSLRLSFYRETAGKIMALPNPGIRNAPLATVIDKQKSEFMLTNSAGVIESIYPDAKGLPLRLKATHSREDDRMLIYNFSGTKLIEIDGNEYRIIQLQNEALLAARSEISAIESKEPGLLIPILYGVQIIGNNFYAAVNSPDAENITLVEFDSQGNSLRQVELSKNLLAFELGDGNDRFYLKDVQFYKDEDGVHAVVPYFQSEISRVLLVDLW